MATTLRRAKLAEEANQSRAALTRAGGRKRLGDGRVRLGDGRVARAARAGARPRPEIPTPTLRVLASRDGTVRVRPIGLRRSRGTDRARDRGTDG